jgi:hypothetical protein
MLHKLGVTSRSTDDEFVKTDTNRKASSAEPRTDRSSKFVRVGKRHDFKMYDGVEQASAMAGTSMGWNSPSQPSTRCRRVPKRHHSLLVAISKQTTK